MINYQKRRDTLLQILQRNRRSMSTSELHEALCKWFENPNLHPKTTFRDLEALAQETFITEGEQGSDKKSNYWKLGRSSFDLKLSPAEAMTLAAIFDHSERFGFKPHTEQLIKLREYAATEINKHAMGSQAWTKRITTGTRFTLLRPGKYDPEHLTCIQEAILGDTSLEVTYLPRDAGDVECIYLLKPLALSYQDSNVYLSAYVHEETWPTGKTPAPDTRRGKYSSNGPGTMCALMLHRMVAVKANWLTIPDPDDYDVNTVKAQKHLMTLHSDSLIELKLRLSPNLHNRLTENRLTDDQDVVQYSDDQWDLSCTLLDTQGLRLFLLSNAGDIEVIAPEEIRAHVRDTLRTAVGFYVGD